MKKIFAVILRICAGVNMFMLAGYLVDAFGRGFSAGAVLEAMVVLLLVGGFSALQFYAAGKLDPPPARPANGKPRAKPAGREQQAKDSSAVQKKTLAQDDANAVAAAAAKSKRDVKADFITRLLDCSREIADLELLEILSEIGRLAKGISEQRNKYPSNRQSYRRFETYYVPTTLVLLNAYLDASAAPVVTDSQKDVLRDAKNGLDAARRGFQRIYDNMYEPTALDISAEVAALENVLRSDGLLDEGRMVALELPKQREKEAETV